MRSIALRLMSSFLVIIAIISAGLGFVGVRFAGERVVAEAERRVASDLNSAREIYRSQLEDVRQVVQLTAERLFLRDAIAGLRQGRAADVLSDVLRWEGLDVLVVTDARGLVLWRPSNPGRVGDDLSDDPLVSAALAQRRPVASTVVVAAAELQRDCPSLVERARCELVATPRARVRPDTVQSDGMMLAAAVPILSNGVVLGAVYGGVLLNQRFQLVDKIKQVVFEDAEYEGKAVGTSTIFLDDVRIATNVLNDDGTRAVGTRASSEVYDRVIGEGRPWIGRAFVVNDWYITAYEPIRTMGGDRVGMLYVGTLEAPYLDLKRQSTLVFLAIALSGAGLTVGLSYVLSRQISAPLGQMVAASRRLARGDLDATVGTSAVAEFAELAHGFNAMAAALRVRDEQLHASASRRIMESERLAIIGKLAADVAHELNNPLQGIVTFSHLLQERAGLTAQTEQWVAKIVDQADRCTKIIRSLLDFARPQKPVKKPAQVNALLEECIALVENQAQFHNIVVVKRFDAGLPPVVLDASLMQQVFMNLIFNAAEAMEGGGQLTIATWLAVRTDVVEVEFTDTGHGVNPAEADRIFEPFFTTKPEGKGTGLGLSICYGIVKEHGGTIALESGIAKGARFTIRLPVREKGGHREHAHGAPDPAHR